MYADDFGEKEKERLSEAPSETKTENTIRENGIFPF